MAFCERGRTDMKNEIFEAIKAGDAGKVASLVENDPSLANVADENGITAVLCAVYIGRRDLAEQLLASGATLNAYEAAALGRLDRLQELVASNPAVVSEYSNDGWTALHLAAFFGQPDATRFLLSHGAPVNAYSRNNMRNTPLNAAAAGGRAEVVNILLAHGADVNAKQEGGFTPLHAAAFQGNVTITRALLAKGTDVNARNDSGQTALDLALGKGRAEVAELLTRAAERKA